MKERPSFSHRFASSYRPSIAVTAARESLAWPSTDGDLQYSTEVRSLPFVPASGVEKHKILCFVFISKRKRSRDSCGFVHRIRMPHGVGPRPARPDGDTRSLAPPVDAPMTVVALWRARGRGRGRTGPTSGHPQRMEKRTVKWTTGRHLPSAVLTLLRKSSQWWAVQPGPRATKTPIAGTTNRRRVCPDLADKHGVERRAGRPMRETSMAPKDLHDGLARSHDGHDGQPKKRQRAACISCRP